MLLAKPKARTQNEARIDRRERPRPAFRRGGRNQPATAFPLRREHPSLDAKRTDTSGIVETTAQLLQMALCSLKGYQELADLSDDETLRTFADIMARQRGAQCRELAKILADDSSRVETTNSCVEELRLAWVRGLWNIDQGEVFAGMEAIEEAEEMLEDAYLNAAAFYGRYPVAAVFCRHAMNLCGARQRLDESDGLLAEDVDDLLARA